MKLIRELTLGLLLLLLLPLVAAAASTPKPAPPLKATMLDGSAFTLADHRGDVVIVNFWATWCVPCRLELPAFAEFYRQHHEQGLQVIAISTDDPEDLEKVRAVAAGLPYPVATAAQTNATEYGRIWRLPLTFIIDRNGRLVADGGAGARKSYDLPALDAEVLPLLQQPR